MGVVTGLDRVAAGEPGVLRLLRGRRVGLLAHPASVDASLRHAHQVLGEAGVEVSALFGPEHGYGGEAQDMVGVASSRQAGLRVHSLYGEDEADLLPKDEWLQDLDVVVVDLQDVGSRYYTFVWTAVGMLRRAAALGVQPLGLDRPNPLGGEGGAGAPQRPGYRSFVGLCDVSVRHGMTLGEILGRVQRLEGIDPQALQVVPLDGWQRAMHFEATGLPWVLPSPNMPTPDTARVYPGGCLLEGTNLSEGRGSTRPFEIFGAPFVDGARLAAQVQDDAAVLRPLSFTPTFHKHAGMRCGGVQIHPIDPHGLRSYALYLKLIAAIAAQCPQSFALRTEPYEFVSDRPAIDLLTGGDEFRLLLRDGGDLADYLLWDEAAARGFAAERREDLLYSP